MRLVTLASCLFAAICLQGPPGSRPDSTGSPAPAAPAATTFLAGLDTRAARVTYLLGNDPQRWTTTERRPREPRPDVGPPSETPDLQAPGDGPRLSLDALRAALAGEPAIQAVSYLGGSGADIATAVTVDGQGNIYLAGVTTSADLPGTAGAAQRTRSVPPDCFVAKLDSTGSRVLWVTYLGGNNGRNDYESNTEHVVGIQVDAQGNVFVAGSTQSTDFPTTANAWQSRPQYYVSKGFDAFLAKLDPQGSSLIFSTYIGGRDGSTTAAGFALDPAGNAYVAGGTYAASFPATVTLGPPGGRARVFVTKFSAAGSLIYSTRLGGESPYDGTRALAVDASGQAHVAGITSSKAFPGVVPWAWVTACPAHGESCEGGFLSKLSAAGDRILYSTYLGGTTVGVKASIDIGGVALDPAGNIFVAGTTGSTMLPVVQAAQKTYGGGYADAFLASFRPDGQVRYATYLGGGGSEGYYDVAVTADAAGLVYLVGRTHSTDFPLVLPMVKGRAPSPLLRGSRQGAAWEDAGRGLGDDVAALVADPLHPNVMYAATHEGVYRTTDGGALWINRSVGLPDDGFGRYASALALDTRSTNVLYVGTATGTYKSIDAAAHWDLVDETSRRADAIAVDPRSPETVLAAGSGFGIRRSTDRGATWAYANSGLGPYPGARALAPVGPSRSWLAASFYTVFRSDDGGLSWSPSSEGLAGSYIDRLVADPDRPRTFYVFGDGLFQSTDEGRTWTQTVSSHVRAFAVARRRAGTFYLGVGEPLPSGPSLELSTDRGATWQALWPDPPPPVIYSLLADSHQPDVVYAVVPLQPMSFLARFASDGRLESSTYVPVLLPSASTVDVLGRLYLAGGIRPPSGYPDAFVARLRAR